MTELEQTSMNARMHELDSLRGIAALTVILDHFVAAYVGTLHGLKGPSSRIITYFALHLFTAGHEAVLLFFILSGFVLDRFRF